jgi:hypothetical protein
MLRGSITPGSERIRDDPDHQKSMYEPGRREYAPSPAWSTNSFQFSRKLPHSRRDEDAIPLLPREFDIVDFNITSSLPECTQIWLHAIGMGRIPGAGSPASA